MLHVHVIVNEVAQSLRVLKGTTKRILNIHRNMLYDVVCRIFTKSFVAYSPTLG